MKTAGERGREREKKWKKNEEERNAKRERGIGNSMITPKTLPVIQRWLHQFCMRADHYYQHFLVEFVIVRYLRTIWNWISHGWNCCKSTDSRVKRSRRRRRRATTTQTDTIWLHISRGRNMFRVMWSWKKTANVEWSIWKREGERRISTKRRDLLRSRVREWYFFGF